MARSRVLFPTPLSPTMTATSPRPRVRCTPLKMRASPKATLTSFNKILGSFMQESPAERALQQLHREGQGQDNRQVEERQNGVKLEGTERILDEMCRPIEKFWDGDERREGGKF